MITRRAGLLLAGAVLLGVAQAAGCSSPPRRPAPEPSSSPAARPPGSPTPSAAATPGPSASAAPRPPAYPFAAIRPSAAPDAQRAALIGYYRAWKAAFVRQDCEPGSRQILSPDAAYPFVAEAQGYGLVITASMARLDADARTVFDGILGYVLAHPSRNNPDLVAAEQDERCADRNGGDSATDGDLDIAYGLLLADRAWGSTGRHDYRGLALRRIAAIRKSTVHPESGLLLLGDWSRPGNSELYRVSRTSDWNPQYFRVFERVTDDPAWSRIRTAHQQAITRLQAEYSPATGLLPDFVRWTPEGAEPAAGKVLESRHDGDYAFNACRTPWRIGVDAITSGDPSSIAAARRISGWFQAASGEDPAAVGSGTTLDGRTYASAGDNAFWAPLAVAAMADPAGQRWLDRLWTEMAGGAVDPRNYYGATLQLQAMLVVTGTWTAL